MLDLGSSDLSDENKNERWFWTQWVMGNDICETIWCKHGWNGWVLEWEWEGKETVLERERIG